MTKMFQPLLLLLSILLLTGKAHSQNTLTLDQFIEIALGQNYALRIVRNQQQITENNVTRGNAGSLPLVDLRTSYSGNLSSADQYFANGTSNSYRNNHNTTIHTGMQASWMVFDGFRGQIRYRQLSELMQLSELSTRIAAENLVSRVASEYYFYVQQRRLLANLQYAVDLSKERVRIEQEHFLLGSGSKVRLLQAEVNLNADSSRLERQYVILNASAIRLSELLAFQNLAEGYIPADTGIVVSGVLDFDQLLPQVMEQNAAIIASKKNYSLSETDLQLIRSRRLPYLNLSSGYGISHNTYENSNLTNQQNWGLNYGLTLGINLYNGGNQRRQESNARILIENNELSLERTINEVMANLNMVYDVYSNNIRLLNLENQNLAVARENLEIAFERYRLGALTGFELREVQKNLLEAEERLLSIQYQAKMAEINLLQLSGRILDETFIN
jgi:outer membrane protein, adhesin transport system